MQSCSIDILTKIGNFLPWEDRLRFEALSSRFRHLPCQPVQSKRFELTIITWRETVSFQFTVSRNMDDWRSLTLNVINENERYNDDKFLIRLRSRNDILLEASQTYGGRVRIKHTQFYMAPSEYFEFSISLLHKLMSFFSIHYYFIRGVERRLLASLAELFNKRNRVHIPEQLEILLFMEGYYINCDPQQEVEFSDEEVAFLESLKGVYAFTLLTSANLKVTEKQAERIKQLLLLAARSTLYYGPRDNYLDIGIGINENFLQKLIDKRAKKFKTNAASDETPEFLLKYIRNCLAGSYALQELDLVLPRTISESDLLSLGFEVSFDSVCMGRREINCHKHKKGKWPSDICVRWRPTWIGIWVTYKEYK